MKILRLTIELSCDDEVLASNDPEEYEWFCKEVLGGPELFLWSNHIGDSLGDVEVIHIEEVK